MICLHHIALAAEHPNVTSLATSTCWSCRWMDRSYRFPRQWGQEADGAVQPLAPACHLCHAGDVKPGCALTKRRSFSLPLCPPGPLPRYYTIQHKTWVLEKQLQRATTEEMKLLFTLCLSIGIISPFHGSLVQSAPHSANHPQCVPQPHG